MKLALSLSSAYRSSIDFNAMKFFIKPPLRLILSNMESHKFFLNIHITLIHRRLSHRATQNNYIESTRMCKSCTQKLIHAASTRRFIGGEASKLNDVAMLRNLNNTSTLI